MLPEELHNPEELTPAQEIYTEICTTYPFFDAQEETAFHERVSKIDTLDPVDQIKQLVDALHNPHAAFYKKEEVVTNSKSKPATSEIKEGIEIIHIPVQSPQNTPLVELYEKYAKQSEGLILDLRSGGSGAEQVGRALLQKLIAKGTYNIGTSYETKPEGGIEGHPCVFHTNNETPYEKPIVILTSNKTFSSGERFVATLKAATPAIIIGTETRGGSANAKVMEKDIHGETYVIKIPTWRFVLPGESRPIEETKIKPDVFYEGQDIVDFAIQYIKNLETV